MSAGDVSVDLPWESAVPTTHTRPTSTSNFNDGSATDGTVIVDALWDEIEDLQGEYIRVKSYGAAGDAALYTGSITSGSPTLTLSASASGIAGKRS